MKTMNSILNNENFVCFFLIVFSFNQISIWKHHTNQSPHKTLSLSLDPAAFYIICESAKLKFQKLKKLCMNVFDLTGR